MNKRQRTNHHTVSLEGLAPAFATVLIGTLLVSMIVGFTSGLIAGLKLTGREGERAEKTTDNNIPVEHTERRTEPTSEPETKPATEPTTAPIFEEVAESRMSEEYTITAYCGCAKCCGEWAEGRPIDEYGKPIIKGAGGVRLSQGAHCASPLPFGTIVEIEGIGTYEVPDRTAGWIADKYNGKIIDIFFEDHNEALKFGKRTAIVTVM